MSADIKRLARKDVGNFTYELKHWTSENVFSIEKIDNIEMRKQRPHPIAIPEIARFDNETDARAYLDSIK